MSQERRRFPRVRCYLPVRFYPQGEIKVIETLTKDLGLGGLRVLSPVLKPVSIVLWVEISLWGEQSLSLPAQTVWFETIPRSEQFDLGIAFLDLSHENSERLSRYLERASDKLTPTKF